jgi:hypothetical protein
MARDLNLERLNRLSQAMADLTESHAAQGRMTNRLLAQMTERLASIETTLTSLAKDVRSLASEQILLGNRIEEAFCASAAYQHPPGRARRQT